MWTGVVTNLRNEPMIERIGAPEGQGMIRLVTGGNNCASLFIPLIRLKKLAFISGVLVPVAFV